MRAKEFITEGKSHDFMAGHCHVMAIALKQLHPDWQIRAHVGYDDDEADDTEYRVDHVYTVAPDGTAYDCRGRFDNEQQLVGPDTTGGVDTQYVNFGPEEIKQAMLRGELKRFSKQDLANAMQVATQAGKQDVSEAPAGYKEIEFVCVNPQFPDATDPALQKKMYRGLKQIDGVVPLWQEWGDYSEGQASLSAIYQGSKNRDKILSLAKQLGVEVDLEQAVSDDYVDRAMRGEHEGQQGMAEGLTEYKNTPLQDYNGLQFMIDSNHPYLRVEAFAPGSGQQLAQVDFKIDDQDELHPEDLHVEERWRGQGIAQIMYDFVKSKGYTIHRSWSQTDAGSEFWNKHRGQKRVWEQGVAEGFSNAVTFFRGEPILSQERLNQLKSSIGKPYPILRKEGSAANIGTYMSPDGDKATSFVKQALAGQGKGGVVTQIQVNPNSFSKGDGGIDEAVIITNIAGLVSNQTPNKNDPLRIQDRKQAMLKYLGPGVKKYLNDPLLSDPKIVQSWYNPEFAQKNWNTINSGKQAVIKPGESNMQERMMRILGPLAENIRRDPQVINYFISHNPGDWVEYNFRMNSDGSGTKVVDVKYYPPAKQGVAENFADGRNPQDKGDAKRHGINTKASVSSLRKTAKQGGRKGQLAHWLANMKSGRAKKKKTNETVIGTLHFPKLIIAIDDHAIDRTRTRGISPATIDQSLRKLNSIADQLGQMESSNTVWVYDVSNNLALGLRRTSSRDMRFTLKTVVAARPFDGTTPIIELTS